MPRRDITYMIAISQTARTATALSRDGAFGVQWRVADVRIVEVPAAINKDRYKTTYQIEPRAMPTDFDDSQSERIEGKDLGVCRSGGHTAFMWFRGLLTICVRARPSGSTRIVVKKIEIFACSHQIPC
jgi:hypothetical protein